jgi:hypothetical protein
MILPRLAIGQPPGPLTLTPGGAVVLTAIGLLIFTVIGASPCSSGAPMLDYGVLPLGGEAAARRSLAILLIEVGVALAVAGAMLSIFFALVGTPRRGRAVMEYLLARGPYLLFVPSWPSWGCTSWCPHRNLLKSVVGLYMFQTS